MFPAVAVRVIGHPAGEPRLEHLPPLSLLPSPLRPHVRADLRIHLWRGINSLPASTVDVPILRYIDSMAIRESLQASTTSGYGSGLRKFHIFCDIFSIPEADRLPSPFAVLKSFALWSCTEPDIDDPIFQSGQVFEPVSVEVARKYLSAIRAWHIAQGWPPPLSKDDYERINFSLRGLARLQGTSRKRPPRPPVTLAMLAALKQVLDLTDPFDAAVWAAASCALWGMMRFGEVSVSSRAAFCGSKHLKRCDALVGHDLNHKRYVKLSLPSAKTALPGEIQEVFLTQQGTLCPLLALRNLAVVVPAGPDDPLFSWRDRNGDIRPLVKEAALRRINSIFLALGFGTSFGHSFRIGGASFYLSQKVNPEIIRIAGRWKSLAYETYIRAFEQVASRHLANLETLSSFVG